MGTLAYLCPASATNILCDYTHLPDLVSICEWDPEGYGWLWEAKDAGGLGVLAFTGCFHSSLSGWSPAHSTGLLGTECRAGSTGLPALGSSQA
jgi:hypothetical protein